MKGKKHLKKSVFNTFANCFTRGVRPFRLFSSYPFNFFGISIHEKNVETTFHVIKCIRTSQREQIVRIFLHAKCCKKIFLTALFWSFTRGVGNCNRADFSSNFLLNHSHSIRVCYFLGLHDVSVHLGYWDKHDGIIITKEIRIPWKLFSLSNRFINRKI